MRQLIAADGRSAFLAEALELTLAAVFFFLDREIASFETWASF